MIIGRNSTFHKREHRAKITHKNLQRKLAARVPIAEELCTRESGAYVLMALGISKKLEASLKKCRFIYKLGRNGYSVNSLEQTADALCFARKISSGICEEQISQIAECASPMKDRHEFFKAIAEYFATNNEKLDLASLEKIATSLSRTYIAPKGTEIFREIFLSEGITFQRKAQMLGTAELARRIECHCLRVDANRIILKDLPDPTSREIRNAIFDYTPTSKNGGISPVSISRK